MNALSVRQGEAMNDQRQSSSEASSPVSEGYGLRGNEFTDGAHVDTVMIGENCLIVAMTMHERERHNGCIAHLTRNGRQRADFGYHEQ
jgi:hypothetical protein